MSWARMKANWLSYGGRVCGRMPHTAGRMPALPTELPVEKVGGAAQGVEEGGGGVGGAIATDLGPGFCPLDVILVGGGLDGQRV